MKKLVVKKFFRHLKVVLKLIEEVFPYQPRPGQVELAQAVLEASLNNEHLIISTPTGFGKTISVLSGLFISQKLKGARAFYVVRTHREAEEVIKESRKLAKISNANFTVLEVRGRQSLCLKNREVPPSINLDTFCNLNKSSCSFFKVLPQFNPKFEGVASSKDLLNLGYKFNVCPYFLTRKIVSFAKVVVLPYPYLFNWKLRSELLRLLPNKERLGLVIDECISGDSLVETEKGPLSAKALFRRTLESQNGTKVVSLNLGKSKTISFGKVSTTYVTFGKEVKIKLRNSYELTVTPNTRFLIKSEKGEKWSKAKTLMQGEKILIKGNRENLSFEEVEGIKFGSVGLFFDFSIVPYHNFFANNILVHNSHNFPYSIYNEQTRKVKLSELKELLLFSKRCGFKVLEKAVFLILKVAEHFDESKEISLEYFLHLMEKEVPEINFSLLFALILQELRKLTKLAIEKQLPIDDSLRSFTELITFINSKQRRNAFIQFENEEKSLSAIKPEIANEAKGILNNFDFSIHLSGTLEWFDDYAKLVGFSEGDYKVFSVEPNNYGKVFLGVLTTLTTKFDKRNDTMYENSVETIAKIINSTSGKDILYVPSYDVLSELLSRDLKKLIDKKMFYESKEISSEEHSLLVKKFEESSHDSIFVAVLGGRLSEGINFEKKDVRNVIVLGVPFQEPTPKLERFAKTVEEIIKGGGVDFAYIYPAVVKVSQALGRVIRSPNDFGVMILLDERYAEQRIFSKLPGWIKRQLRGIYKSEDPLINDMKNFMSTLPNTFSYAHQ